jgi:hypothetical protein
LDQHLAELLVLSAGDDIKVGREALGTKHTPFPLSHASPALLFNVSCPHLGDACEHNGV